MEQAVEKVEAMGCHMGVVSSMEVGGENQQQEWLKGLVASSEMWKMGQL